jgi:hypothetical protein
MEETVIKRDVFGQILENQVNSSPCEGGVIRKARYSPHQGRMELVTEQANRMAILRENAELYKQNKGGFRRDMAGGVPLRIPEMDYNELYENNPWLNHCDKETKAKFFMKLYREHPEYRIG